MLFICQEVGKNDRCCLEAGLGNRIWRWTVGSYAHIIVMLEQVMDSRDGQWLLGGQSHFSLMPACIRVMLGQVVCFRDGILEIPPPQCDACQPDSDAGHLNGSRDILWLLGAALVQLQWRTVHTGGLTLVKVL